MTEVVNFWKGQWGVSKGVNDLDWGVGRESPIRSGDQQD